MACGVVAKLILNLILIPIPSIGIYGVAIGSIVCHIISFSIGFIVLKRSLKMNFKVKDFIIKPLIATLIMSIASYLVYILKQFISWKIATIISIIFAVIIYAISVALLKILSKEEIYKLPKGNLIYNLLVKLKIYKVE